MFTIYKTAIALSLLLGVTLFSAAEATQPPFDTNAALERLRRLKEKTNIEVRGNIDELKRKNEAAEADVNRRLGEAAGQIEQQMTENAEAADELMRELNRMRRDYKKDIIEMTNINEKIMEEVEKFKNILAAARLQGKDYYEGVKRQVRGFVQDYIQALKDSQEDMSRHLAEIMQILDESN